MEFHISKTKGCIVRGSTRVLARAKKEVRCDGDDVGDGFSILGGRVVVGLMEDEDDYADWDWFYTGGGVFLAVAAKLPRDTEVNVAEGIFPDFRVPQLGELLAHCTDGVFHCSRSDGFLHGNLASISIPLCKYLDDGGGVVAVLEEWVDGVRQAELFPTAPMRIHRSARLAVTPRRVFSWTRPRSVRKSSLFTGGTFARAWSVGRNS
jgi:hypothetical protein